MIGTVEKEEPIPMVINKPTNNIKNAARLLLCKPCPKVCTKSVTPLVVLITLAKPDAAIITKPIIAIRRKPCWKISLLSFSLKMPNTAKMTKPTKPPMIVELVTNCVVKVATIAIRLAVICFGVMLAMCCSMSCVVGSAVVTLYSRGLR